MDSTQLITSSVAIIGMVNGIQFALNREWKSFALFFSAVVIGTVFGYLQWFELGSIEMGFAAGLTSSGMYKMTQVFSSVKKNE